MLMMVIMIMMISLSSGIRDFDWSFGYPHGMNVADHNENASSLLVQMEVTMRLASFLRQLIAMLALFRVAK